MQEREEQKKTPRFLAEITKGRVSCTDRRTLDKKTGFGDCGRVRKEFRFEYNEFEVASCEKFGERMRRKLDIGV